MISDDKLKESLLEVARHGWSRPTEGTPVGARLLAWIDQESLDHDAEITALLREGRATNW